MTHTNLFLSAVLLLTMCGCERKPAGDSAADSEQATVTQDGAAESDTEDTVSTETADEAEPPLGPDAGSEPGEEASADSAARDGWVTVSATTPKGATVSFDVPADWVEARPPNKDTLLVRFAPADSPVAGTKATLVAPEFDGGLAKLVDQTKTRLASFAEIESEGPMKVGSLRGYELVASWQSPMGSRDTAQFLLATRDEALAVTCEVAPGQMEELSSLCRELFMTIALRGAKPKP